MNWSYDLTPLASDKEDDLGNLTWSISGENISLLAVDIQGHNMNFSLVTDAWGNNTLTLTLEDSGSETDDTVFWVNVTPVNDPPAWGQLADLHVDNDTVWDNLTRLGDHVTDIDDLPADLNITIVSYTNDDKITLAIDNDTYLDLINAPEEFMDISNVTVRASDGVDWVDASFNITFNLTKPEPPKVANATMNLFSPANNTLINTDHVTLEWTNVTNMTDIEYRIFLSANKSLVEQRDILVLIGSTTDQSFYVEGPLLNNTTYYWTVLPVNATTRGVNLDGVWSFDVDLSAVIEDHSFELRSVEGTFPLKQGKKKSIVVELVNTGDSPTTVVLTLDGTFKGTILNSTTVLLAVGETRTVRLDIDVPKGQKPGDCTIDVYGEALEDPDYNDTITFNMEVKKSETAGAPISFVWAVPLALVIVILGIAIGVFMATRKSKPKRTPVHIRKPKSAKILAAKPVAKKAAEAPAVKEAAATPAVAIPVAEPYAPARRPKKFNMALYLTEDPVEVRDELKNVTGGGVEGLYLCPVGVEGVEDQETITIEWTTEDEERGEMNLADFEGICERIISFFEDKEYGALLFEGVERFVEVNSFDDLNDLIKVIKANFKDSKFNMLLQADPACLKDDEIEQLRSELTVIEPPPRAEPEIPPKAKVEEGPKDIVEEDRKAVIEKRLEDIENSLKVLKQDKESLNEQQMELEERKALVEKEMRLVEKDMVELKRVWDDVKELGKVEEKKDELEKMKWALLDRETEVKEKLKDIEEDEASLKHEEETLDIDTKTLLDEKEGLNKELEELGVKAVEEGAVPEAPQPEAEPEPEPPQPEVEPEPEPPQPEAEPVEEKPPEPKVEHEPVVVTAVPETPLGTEGLEDIKLIWGDSILFLEKDGGFAFNLFKRYIDDEAKGLALSQYSPIHLREKYGLSEARLIKISIGGFEEDSIPANNLFKIMQLIQQFLEGAMDGVFLFEGVDIMVQVLDIEVIFRFFENLVKKVSDSECCCIVSINPDRLSGPQVNRFENTFKLKKRF
jgi:hypothetical protein